MAAVMLVTQQGKECILARINMIRRLSQVAEAQLLRSKWIIWYHTLRLISVSDFNKSRLTAKPYAHQINQLLKICIYNGTSYTSHYLSQC